MPNKTRHGLVTRVQLIASGWRPNRNVRERLSLPKSFDPHDEAKRVLTEYGDLQFGKKLDRVILNPFRGDEVAPAIKEFENVLKTHLYPLGVMEHQDCHYLLIDETGVVYTLIEMPEGQKIFVELAPFASTFDKALSLFLRPVSNQNDLKSIGLLGKVWELERKREAKK